MLYHVVISDGTIVKYNTVDEPTPLKAMQRSIEMWNINAGKYPHARLAVYPYYTGDQKYNYRWAEHGTFTDRPNLLSPQDLMVIGQ